MRLPRIQARVQAGAVLAAVEPGFDIDITNAADLADLLLESVPSSARGMVLDLRQVEYVDSAGIRMLFGLARQLATGRQRLGLWLPESSPVRRLVSITNLDQVAIVCADEAGCIAAVCAED